jgi:hypothetical protein
VLALARSSSSLNAGVWPCSSPVRACALWRRVRLARVRVHRCRARLLASVSIRGEGDQFVGAGCVVCAAGAIGSQVE